MAEAKKILIIDDDPDARTILKTQLTARGFRVIESGDGAAGLALARQEHPDVIVLDLMMPQQDGISTYHDFKQDAAVKGVPVVFLSALSAGSDLTGGGQAFSQTSGGVKGAKEDYIVLGKPCEPEELIRTIHRVLAKPGP